MTNFVESIICYRSECSQVVNICSNSKDLSNAHELTSSYADICLTNAYSSIFWHVYLRSLRVDFSTLGKSILKVREALSPGGELLKISVKIELFLRTLRK